MRALVAGLTFALIASAGPAAQPAFVPVMVGDSEPYYDACGSVGQVVGLNPRGDNFLAVRSCPSGDFTKIDELYTANTVWLCDERGSWFGMVYSRERRAGKCGVSSPLPLQAYGGPCRVGWVFGQYIQVIAG